MPTYEYRCKDCGHTFDAVQSFTDDSLTECPACSGALRKVFGNVGITFKGSGFYRTDSRSGSADKASTNGDGNGGGSSDAASSGDKGDGKAAAKTESSSKEAPSKNEKGTGKKESTGSDSSTTSSGAKSKAPAKS